VKLHLLHKIFFCTCLTSCQQQLLTKIQTTTGWHKLLLQQKKQIFTSCEHLHVLHLHTNDGLDTKPTKHAFKTNDASSQACRKDLKDSFQNMKHFIIISILETKSTFLKSILHACLQQHNQPFKLITHTCSNTRKSSTSLCSCTSSLCMHFILQLSLKHTILSKLK